MPPLARTPRLTLRASGDVSAARSGISSRSSLKKGTIGLIVNERGSGSR